MLGGSRSCRFRRDRQLPSRGLRREDGEALWLPNDPVQSGRVAQWMSYASAEVNNTHLKVRIHNLLS